MGSTFLEGLKSSKSDIHILKSKKSAWVLKELKSHQTEREASSPGVESCWEGRNKASKLTESIASCKVTQWL